MLCDNLEGWDGGVGERFEREGTYTHTYTHTHRHTHTHTHTHTLVAGSCCMAETNRTL